jgi:hypothetical protein
MGLGEIEGERAGQKGAQALVLHLQSTTCIISEPTGRDGTTRSLCVVHALTGNDLRLRSVLGLQLCHR